MEMTWLETIELLGVDLLAVLLLAVVVLDLLEHSAHSVMESLRIRRMPGQRSSAPTRLATVSFE
jgi:hypothetical protein